MAAPGWYPDPSGRPAHFRYWDGSRWSTETTTNPLDPPPSAPSSSAAGPEQDRSGRRSVPALLALAAVTLVVVLVAVLVVRAIIDDDTDTAIPPPPSSSVSAWDETSRPDPTPTPSAPPPAESPDPPPEEISCPTGAPGGSSTESDPDRVASTKISFARIDDYGAAGAKYGLSWFHDTMAQSQTTEPGWESFFAVGDIEIQQYFDTPANAATASMQCMINDNFFRHFTGRTDVRNEAITVDGHPGWIVSAEIRVDNPGLSVEGDVVTLIFVDDGRDDRLSGFVSTVPIGDEARIALSEKVIKSLRIEN